MILLLITWVKPILCVAGDTIQAGPGPAIAFNEFSRFHLSSIDSQRAVVPKDAEPGLYNIATAQDTCFSCLSVFSRWADTLRFVQLSDPHCGYSQRTDSNYARAVQLVNLLNPDLVIITGDIAEKGQSPQGLEQYRTFNSISADFKVAWFVIPGNHDYYDRWWRNRGLGNYRAMVSPDTDYTFTYDDLALFIMVNTGPDAIFWDAASFCRGFTRAQLDWMDKQLADSRARLRFVATHGPVVDLDDKDESVKQGVREFLEIAQKNRVDAVLSGHTHQNRCFGPDLRAFGPTDARPLAKPLYIQTTTCAKGPQQQLGFSYFVADSTGLLSTPTRAGLQDITIDQRFFSDSSKCAVFVINRTTTAFKKCALYLSMAPGKSYTVVGPGRLQNISPTGLCKVQIPVLRPGITSISIVPTTARK